MTNPTLQNDSEFVQLLVDDLWVEIIVFGTAYDMISIGNTCKYFNNLSDCDNNKNHRYYYRINQFWYQRAIDVNNDHKHHDNFNQILTMDTPHIDINQTLWKSIYKDMIHYWARIFYASKTSYKQLRRIIKYQCLEIFKLFIQLYSNQLPNITDTNVDKYETIFDFIHIKDIDFESNDKNINVSNTRGVNWNSLFCIACQYNCTTIIDAMFELSSTFASNFQLSLNCDEMNTRDPRRLSFDTLKHLMCYIRTYPKTWMQKQNQLKSMNLYLCHWVTVYPIDRPRRTTLDELVSMYIETAKGRNVDGKWKKDCLTTLLNQLMFRMCGVYEGEPKFLLIEKLIQNGANIHSSSGENNETALSSAMTSTKFGGSPSAHMHVAILLIENSTNDELNYTYLGKIQNTYLHHAVHCQNSTAIELLLNNGFTNIWAQNNLKHTALSYATDASNEWKQPWIDGILTICDCLLSKTYQFGGNKQVYDYIESQGATKFLSNNIDLARQYAELREKMVKNVQINKHNVIGYNSNQNNTTQANKSSKSMGNIVHGNVNSPMSKQNDNWKKRDYWMNKNSTPYMNRNRSDKENKMNQNWRRDKPNDNI